MHPTGVYEFLLSALLFAVLWRYRTRIRADGSVLMLYFVVTGGLRFVLEFVALAPVITLGLTEAQLMSLAWIAIGASGLWYLLGRSALPAVRTERS